jgi:acetate kinase
VKILCINTGSATIKFDVVETSKDPGDGAPKKVVSGLVGPIGANEATLEVSVDGTERDVETVSAVDYREVARRVIRRVNDDFMKGYGSIDAVGHRVVHGGLQFSGPVRLDDAALSVIEDLVDLAPLHNQPALEAIYAARDELSDAIPMAAVFDTAFHRTMPRVASEYAIPRDLTDKHGIRRFGFHGLAHRSMVRRYEALSGKNAGQARLITLQLGGGCSASAIRNGHSVDTSMGLTPLEGMVMGSRSGDVDPSLPGFLSRREGVSLDTVEEWLNKKSGLLGLSGVSSDMRHLPDAARGGNKDAAFAIDMFCYRARKYVGAYLAVLGGADAIIFGGGVGGNVPVVRSRICDGMEWCGLQLDGSRNDAAVNGSEGRISANSSMLEAYVAKVDETGLIAEETTQLFA